MFYYLRFLAFGFLSLVCVYQSFSQAEIQNPNSAAGLYWRVKGNASTDTSQNFLGTTDANYMTISTNNVRRMTIDTGGRVGIGTTTPSLLGMMEVVNTIGTNTGIIISNYGSPNELWFRRANGNISAPAIVGTGGSLARIDGRGYDGSTYLQAARIEMLVDSTSGLGQMTGRVIFSTAPAGSAPVERVRINRNGLMGIGTTAPATRLDVNGDLAIRQASLTLANGVNNNVAISPFPNGNSYYRITGPNAAFSLTGLLASGDGRIVVLQNSTTQVMTLKDQATSSNLTARIMTGGGDLAIGDSGTVTLIYSNTDNRWQVQAFTNGTLANGTFGNEWSIIGNAGLNNAINFLGTTDNADVIIKRQNEEALRVYPGGALVGIGNTATGLVPVSGFGTRFVWAPAKNAIRAGSVNGAQWDNANVGSGSAAFGANNTASANNSFAAGNGNTASGTQSVAFGNNNTVSGQNSMVSGNNNTVTATHALVSGNSNNAAGNFSVVFNNTASSTAAATTSVAGGFQSQTQANLSIAIGWADTAKNLASVALGGFSNEAAGDYSFVTGNNNLTSAAQAAAFGQNNTASGTNAFVSGSGNTVSGQNSIASGNANTVTATHALVSGNAHNAAGNYSVVLNNTNSTTAAATTSIAGGFQSQVQSNLGLAIGWGDTTSGVSAGAFGRGNYSRSFGEFSVGTFGTDYVAASAGSFNSADRVFNVGIGTAANARADAFIIFKNGNIRAPGLATGGPFILTPTATTDKIMYANANGDLRAMASGSTGDVLTYTASGPAWSAATSSAWNLTGNTATVDGTNFIGTTDNIPFNIRVNNTAAGRLDSRGNAYFGLNAGNNNVTPYSNVAVGSGALFNVTTRSNLVAVGDSALHANTTGGNNTALGSNALAANVTGSGNTAVGRFALRSNTASANTAVGTSALTANTSGLSNTAVGAATLATNSTGTNNVAIGAGALINNSAGFGNTAVGMNSGTVNTVGIRNSLFGDSADVTNNNLTNASAIGWNARVAQSNSMVLGSIAGVNGATSTVNVGVGTTSPHSRLHTEGSFAAAYAVASTSTYTLTDNDHTVRRFGTCNTIVFPDATTCKGRIYYIINSNGTGSNVGFSTTSPQIIYDDVTNTIITFIAPNERIQVQSDGSDWIVIGR